jgi:hypothetical protein
MPLRDALTFFKIIPDGLSKEEIKKKVKRAYRKLVLKHHPDRGGSVVLFRQVQAMYETFQTVFETYQEPSKSRNTATLFFVFRDFLASIQSFSEKDLEHLAHDDEDLKWFLEFAAIAEGARYISVSLLRNDTWNVDFLPSGITLPRFYRVYALKCLTGSPQQFKAIEKMFVKEVPWNFDVLYKMFNG